MKEDLSRFPTEAGVYLFRDEKRQVLYVGKAVNLQARLKQYFSLQDKRSMIPFLLKRMHTVETIVVESEKEALLTEHTLIKKYRPPYNVLLKDDKTFISLKITEHAWPMVKVVRVKGKRKKDGKYFGPFTQGYKAKQTLELLLELFPLRRCQDRELINRTRPCILYGMGKCVAPCVGFCSKEEYQALIKQVENFLSGKQQKVIQTLQSEIEKASEKMEYEQAAALLKRLKALQATLNSQKVSVEEEKSFDVWGVYKQGSQANLTKILYRDGKLSGAENYPLDLELEKSEEVMDRLLYELYEGDFIPEEVLIPKGMGSAKLLSALLSSLSKNKVHVHTPLRGEKVQYLQLAEKNASNTFRQKETEGMRDEQLLLLQERLKLKNFPSHIECFDHSHTAGSYAGVVKVAFLRAKPQKSLYRTYSVKDAKKHDDYGAFYEVLQRRFSKKSKEALPDLLLIDGGKGHLSTAQKVLDDLGLAGIDLIGIAKEESNHSKGLTQERLFFVGREPLVLERTDPSLLFLQRLRDEAHRFALKFHHKKQKKGTFKTSLDGIPGVGPKKKRALLSYFGSVEKIKHASLEELSCVQGISPSLAKEIKAYLLA